MSTDPSALAAAARPGSGGRLTGPETAGSAGPPHQPATAAPPAEREGQIPERLAELTGRALHGLADTARGYEPPGEERPLGGYLALVAAYTGLTATAGLLIRRRRGVPEAVSAADIALLGVATHKLSRLLSKDPVTSFLRAPMTAYSGQAGPAEVAERPRRSGILHAAGELVTCPFCVGQWVATGLMGGLLVAPRVTRLLASTMAVVTAADFLHVAYQAAEGRLPD